MATNLLNFLLLLRVVLLSYFNVCDVHGASIRYDQSQFGDYNVQIHLKNIELYAILDEGILNSEVMVTINNGAIAHRACKLYHLSALLLALNGL